MSRKEPTTEGQGFEIVRTLEDNKHLNYVVNAYIYDEDPTKMVVTSRGSGGGHAGFWKVPGFRSTYNAGVSVFDISDPAHPRLADRWDAPCRVEGQDRHGDVLVVTNITDGVLYTFNPDSVGSGPIGTCKLSTNGALHVRLYPPPGLGQQMLYALVTSGFATSYGIPGMKRMLMAVDVSDSSHPQEVAHVHQGIPWGPEGIFIRDDRAYVGGVNGTTLSAYSLKKLPERIEHLTSLEDRAYHQCVGQNTSGANAADPTLYAALWVDPGGLGVFDISSTDGTIVELSRLVIPELAKANRIVLVHDRRRALLPLESHPGGVGLVDVSDTSHPTLVDALKFTDDGDTCYCACGSGDYVYAFAVKASRMFVLKLG